MKLPKIYSIVHIEIAIMVHLTNCWISGCNHGFWSEFACDFQQKIRILISILKRLRLKIRSWIMIRNAEICLKMCVSEIKIANLCSNIYFLTKFRLLGGIWSEMSEFVQSLCGLWSEMSVHDKKCCTLCRNCADYDQKYIFDKK